MNKITHNTPIALFDYESCFGPEFWPHLAEVTGIEALKVTTKEKPDFDALMQYRLDILNENSITLDRLREVSGMHDPLEGAREFLDWLRGYIPVILVSDMVYQLAEPVIAKLGYPTMLSTTIVHDTDGNLVYDKRTDDRKASTVRAFKNLNFHTIAMGDSLNDIGLLKEADTSMLFTPNDAMRAEFPDLPEFNDLRDVRGFLEEHVAVLTPRAVAAS